MTVERLFKRQLALAYPLQLRGDEFILFRGSSQGLEFISDYSPIYGQGDFRRIEYSFNAGEFLYKEQDLFSYRPGAQSGEPWRTLGTFDALSFRFFNRTQQGEAVWSAEWMDGMGMPLAVQIEIDGDVLLVPLANRS
jgi:hypothetical protein